MKRLGHIIITLFLTIGSLTTNAQIENVIVETFYIADATDAADMTTMPIPEGSITYRVFVDLAPESVLLSLYGDENHPIKIKSSEPFYNHSEDGESFGFDVNRNRYEDDIVALDSWLTLGLASKKFNAGAYVGIPKELDNDGSVVGGENNDGGSNEVPEGLLTNQDSELGIPITNSDGMILNDVALPEMFEDAGIIDVATGDDPTIFGSLNNEITSFESTLTKISNSGTVGATEDNIILLGQFTTLGELEFSLNVEVEIEEDGQRVIKKYVSDNTVLEDNEEFNSLLNYPFECGCMDPSFLEASPLFACEDNSQCLTPIVLGCMDEEACNFNPEANFDLPELCCYVGQCNDLDISLVCPDLSLRSIFVDEFFLYPNPAKDHISIDTDGKIYNDVEYIVIDISGRLIKMGIISESSQSIDVSKLDCGTYYIRFTRDTESIIKSFIKN